MNRHLQCKNNEGLEAILLNDFINDQHESLIKAYSESRYCSAADMAQSQNGLNINVVRDWFVAACVYEPKTGTKFELSTKQTAPAVETTPAVETAPTEEPEGLAWPQIQKLKEEF